MNGIHAQNSQPYVRIARLIIDSSQLENYVAKLKTGLETSVRIEPGVLSMRAVFDNLHPSHITILETYASKDAYLSHIQTEHFKKYKTETLAMVKSLELVDVTPIAYEEKKN